MKQVAKWLKIDIEEDGTLHTYVVNRIEALRKYYMTDRERLEASIAKFAIILNVAEEDTNIIELDSSTCPLCWEYLEKNDNCNGCPIMKHTGITGCKCTPFFEIWESENGDEARDALVAEIKFLCEVLERYNAETEKDERDSG